MKLQLIVFLGLVALGVALPTNFVGNQEFDDSTLEKPIVDNTRVKRQYDVPQPGYYDITHFAAPSQGNFYQGRGNDIGNTPTFNSLTQPSNNFVASNIGLTNQFIPTVPHQQINSFTGHTMQQFRNTLNANVPLIQYTNSQGPYFSPDSGYNTPISRSDNFDPVQIQSQYSFQGTQASPRNSNWNRAPFENGQGSHSANNGRTFSKFTQYIPIDFSHTRPGEIWSNIKEEVTPFINSYTRTAHQQNTPVQTAPIYYNSQFIQDPGRPASNSNIRQIIPSPQEVFNSAFNIGNRIIERIPGYQLGANVFGFVGNITRVGAHILNNQIQGQFGPGPSRPSAFPNPRPTAGPVLAFPMPISSYPPVTSQLPTTSTPAKITNTVTLNDESVSSSGDASDQYRPSSGENEDDSSEHHGSEENHQNSQQAQQTSQESSHASQEVHNTSQETGPSQQLDANHQSNEGSTQINEDDIRRDSQENTEPIGDFNNPVVENAVSPADDDILDDDDDRIDPKSIKSILG